MERQHNWILDYCDPVIWTVNFIPPEGDWDREVEPGSMEEIISKAEAYPYAVVYFARQLGKSFIEAAEQIAEAYDHVAHSLLESWGPIKDCQDQIKEINEYEAQKHGTYAIKSQKAGIELPKRKVNCGPPAKRFDRR